MHIKFENVLPAFLQKEQHINSGLWNLDVEIKKGERVQIIAPSGSGKTSLIHFIYGIRKDYQGNILLNGKFLHDYNAEEIASMRSHICSIIFQDIRLFPDHSLYDNINIKRLLQPFHPPEKINEMAERLGIAHKLNSIASKCSYGEQQRAAIIRALQQPFDFLLMDEPISNLDEDNRKKAMELITEEANCRNAALLLADLKKIEYFKAERVIHL